MNETNQILQVIAKSVAMPILLELDKESGQPIVAVLKISQSGTVAVGKVCTRDGEFENEAKGEIRVVLGEGGLPGSFKFSAESVLNGLSPGTGFSGFSIRGKMTLADGGSARLTARTNRYNVWSWGRDFVF